MVNYSLEEFKEWLEADQSRKENLTEWTKNFRNWQKDIKNFENFVRAVVDPVPNQPYTYDIFRPYREVFAKWKAEREEHIRNLPALLAQIKRLKRILTQRKTQIVQEITLIKEVLRE